MAQNIFNNITEPAIDLIVKISKVDVAGLMRIKEVPVKIGVYFLFKNNELVYIGKSKNIDQRLMHHNRTKDFDEHSYIELNESELDAYERVLINIYKPSLNIDSLTIKLKNNS